MCVLVGLLELTSAVDYIGRPIEHILVTLDLPHASPSATLAEAVAEIASNHLHIAMQGYKPLDVQLPFAVSAEGASALLSQDSGQLCLKLPYLPCKAFIQQVRCSRCFYVLEWHIQGQSLALYLMICLLGHLDSVGGTQMSYIDHVICSCTGASSSKLTSLICRMTATWSLSPEAGCSILLSVGVSSLFYCPQPL